MYKIRHGIEADKKWGAAQKIAKEVFADAYAGINAFSAGADHFTDAVNDKMDDLWIGKSRNSQENGVRQTRGPDGQNGRYSMEDGDGDSEDSGSQMAQDIEKLTGVKNTEGNSIFMNTSAVKHIEKRHGSNGEADHSMSHDQDLARINYVLQNYDHIEYDTRKSKEYRNRDNSLAPSVLISKKINGTYFVVEAVPDTGKTAIVSAYINKKGTAQVLDDNAPSGDVRNELASAPIDNLPYRKSGVKGDDVQQTDDSDIHYSVEDEDSDGNEWDFDAAEAKAEAQTRKTKEYILQKELGPEGYREYLKQKKVKADRAEAQRKEENSRRAEERRRKREQEKSEKAQRWEQNRAEKRTKLESNVKPTQAKKEFRNNVTALFSIPAGKKKEINSILDRFADRVAKKEYVGQEDRNALFDQLYREGVMNVDAEEVYQLGRDYVERGRIYVPDSIRKEFGDDWGAFQRRAFNNQVYLTSDRSAAGIDQWNMELADILPGLFDSEETDLRMALEKVVDIAEEGKAEKMSLPEYTALLANQEHVSEDELLDELERKLDNEIIILAKSANLETKLRTSLIDKQEQIEQRSFNQIQKEAEARQRRKDLAERERAQRELKELQNKTLKALQWLNKNRNRAPEELKETWNEVLGDIDLYAVGAANEMNWSDKYQATWKDLAQMYKDAQKEDPNFFPSPELERIVHRLDDTKIADLDLDALQDLYKAAVGLRTEYYNRNNVMMDQEYRIFEEVYEDTKSDIQNAPGEFTGTELDRLFNTEQLTPMNVLQRMVGWNPDSSFYAMAKQLENGERSTRAYSVKAERMLENFLQEHADWVKKADGQGKDAIWYTITVPELLQLGHGDAPIFGKSVTVSMTPAQKVHMYLESKNVDNLRHMAGGRTFADQKLYSEGKRKEALAHGTTVRLAPETVKEIVKTLTPEEKELAKILEKYYNSFAKKEINRISNILYGYDRR